MGSPAFALPSLHALVNTPSLVRVMGVVTQPDKPAGRGQKMTASAIKAEAVRLGIPVLEPTKLKAPDTLQVLTQWAPELIVVAAYGRILPSVVLALPRHGCVNVHASLLPRYRGASPIAHAILAGDAETGVGIMRMEEGLDTGPVYAQRSMFIAADDTTGSLTEKLAELGAELLVSSLPRLLTGELGAVPQSGEPTYASLLRKEHGALDFARPAEFLARHVRAMSPWPGSFVRKGEVRVQVLRAHVVRSSEMPNDIGAAKVAPGTVIVAGSGGVMVAASEGALAIDEVKPAGRGAMTAGAWALGRQVAVGDRFDPVPVSCSSALQG